VIQNPGFLSDHPQNRITGRFCRSRHSLKISERSVHNFLSYLANTQTSKQTNSDKNITFLAEVKMFCRTIILYATTLLGYLHSFSIFTFRNIFSQRLQKLTVALHYCLLWQYILISRLSLCLIGYFTSFRLQNT